MMEHAIRVASEAAAARIPDVIAEWTRSHPALRPAARAAQALNEGSTIATGPGAEA
jgi:hypothetical protein